MKIRRYITKTSFFLTISDVFTYGPISIMTPMIAIYLQELFKENTVFYIGIAVSIYFLFRSIVQIPIGMFTDRVKYDTDEILILLIGCFIMGLSYMFIPFITQPWEYFVIMAFIGIGTSMNLNAWRKLFVRNLDPSHQGIGYGFYETILSISSAIICIVGGYFSSISKEYFSDVIIIFGASIIIGGLIGGFIITFKDRKSKNLK